ncbi:Sulfate/thiosulfate import ATP-binding protein CysA 2 [Paraburkholderia sacchari]|uniref:ABC transporter ATP-binding protein n=1 Tax=Paraburkholderia sacchari TaxID=159450 RepID=UPI0039A47320
MNYVEANGLTKQFGTTPVFRDISFSLRKGEFVTLLGPSGCGKSTLLRSLAGLTDVDAGTIRVDGEDITRVAPQKRGIGMVFQSYALFPNMTVAQNIEFGLKLKKMAADERARKVVDAIRLVALGGKEHQYPHELSGGQRQRVALARALVVEPRILLLDEPLSALDARIRRSLREQIRDIQSRLGVTTIFVTHDQEEALTLSDRIFVMDQGRIVQEGEAETIYARPASEFVARFIGNYNMLSPGDAHALFDMTIDGHLAIRPEAIQVASLADVVGEKQLAPLTGTVRHRQLLGNVIRYQVESSGVTLRVDRLNQREDQLFAPGTLVALTVDPQQMREVH